jgi:hypothetical protein
MPLNASLPARLDWHLLYPCPEVRCIDALLAVYCLRFCSRAQSWPLKPLHSCFDAVLPCALCKAPQFCIAALPNASSLAAATAVLSVLLLLLLLLLGPACNEY